jgi:phage-related protein (TIGR01555 family)
MMKNPVKFFTDGFTNVLKGLGTRNDARTNNVYYPEYRINQQQASYIYTYNWLAAKCIDIPVDDATRKWREIIIDNDAQREQIEEFYKEWDIKGKINLAMKWARAYGGAAIIFIFENEDPAEPLDTARIKKDSLSNILVLDRYNIITDRVSRDILDPNFGKPETYYIARSGTIIHHTRVIDFQGFISTLQNFEEENYWGLSHFTRGWVPIMDSQQTSNNINTAVYEANIDVYGIEGLNTLIAQGEDTHVIKRLNLAHEQKSVVNGIALDANDTYEKKSNSFSELAQIDDRALQKVSGAWNIPVTRLIGISPSGMNATGESDMYNYYDYVQGIQNNMIAPKLDEIDQIMTAALFGSPVEFDYKFVPLKQLTEQEQAEVDAKNAATAQIYEGMGAITVIDIMKQLEHNGTYVAIDADRVAEAEKEWEDSDSLGQFEMPPQFSPTGMEEEQEGSEGMEEEQNINNGEKEEE